MPFNIDFSQTEQGKHLVHINANQDDWQTLLAISKDFQDVVGEYVSDYAGLTTQEVENVSSYLEAVAAKGETAVTMDNSLFFQVNNIIETYELVGFGSWKSWRKNKEPVTDKDTFDRIYDAYSNKADTLIDKMGLRT